MNDAAFPLTVPQGPPVLFAALDTGGRVRSLNKPLRDVLGKRDLLGQDFATVCVPKAERDYFWAALGRVVATGEIEMQRLRLTRDDGEDLVLEGQLTAIVDDAGHVTSVAWTGTDLRPRQRLEALLAESQRVETIGFLAGGVAHDFNNLLMSIQSKVSLMLLDIDDAIDKQVQAGSDLTRQLLGFASPGNVRPRRLDLNTLVEESAHTFGMVRKDVRFELDLGPELLRIEADRRQIEQALLNLFVNAVHHMPPGRHLSLVTFDLQHPEDDTWPAALDHEHYALLAVNNTGDGHPPADARRAAACLMGQEPFPLGLQAAANLLQRYGGFICFDRAGEEPGGTYYVGLPGFEKSLSLSLDKPAVESPGERPVQLLLVDDEERVMEVSARVLRRLNFTVLEAGGGEEALRVYREKGDEIDIVLLDMAMPGMSGGEVFDRLREMDPDVRVLLMSGYNKDDTARRILRAGGSGFLQKPFNMRDASTRIHKLLGEEPNS